MMSLTARLPVRIELRPDTDDQALATLTEFKPDVFPEPTVGGLTRSEIVDRILEMNPSATSEFLDRFNIRLLGEYLEHLNAASTPRGRMARWIRPEGSCGISWSARNR